VLKAVIWRTQAARMALPRNGDQVIAHGYISVYEQGGAYQLYVDRLEAAGIGRLWLEFERLKARLEAEGLFDPARKRLIPPQPRRLGVVTSATGAALRDILRTLAARYPLVDVILAPAAVQGDQAPPAIVAALADLNRWSAEREPVDAIILARGGGSIEELWAFNDERVARAVVASAVPVVTGVGHETDFTIADFAADLRAPTPTGAAAHATPDARQLRASVVGLAEDARRLTGDRVRRSQRALADLSARAARVSPERRLDHHRQRIDDLARAGRLAIGNRLRAQRARLDGLRLHLAALDPVAVLSRGYAIVSTPDGAIISSTAKVASGDPVRVRVADGEFGARVVDEQRRASNDE
jgi:exodeoxyribonuclease VII large subunit